MANPSSVSAGTDTLASWGNDVRSRVVGIYATTSAAETDGVTEAGRIVGLTDGSVWVKMSATSGDWQRLGTISGSHTVTGASIGTSWSTIAGGFAHIGPSPRSKHGTVNVRAFFTAQFTTPTAAKVEVFCRITINGGTSWNNGPIIGQNGNAGWAINITAGHAREQVVPSVTSTTYFEVRGRSTQTDSTLDQGYAEIKLNPDTA